MNTALNQRPYPVLSVSQFTAQIKGVLENTFHDVAVVGEVSNFKTQPSGHWYFSLKDENSTLVCACFRNANAAIKFDLQDGLKVIARGRLDVYPPRGSYQLIVQTIEPVGIGQWQLAFDQLKEKLGKEGLLEAARKRPIPLMPRKVGIVTSTKAAALRDVLTALRRRNPNVQVVIAHTRVQGDGVENEIAQAIKDIQQIDDIEVMLVVRGGGSIEDLWCFNTEVVARAVSQSRIPVISGVGHETDITICDLVADLRAPTPTAAAELVSRGRAELLQRWSNVTRLLFAGMEHKLTSAHRNLERLNPRHALSRQQEKLNKLQLLLAGRQQRLVTAMDNITQRRESTLHRLDEKLKALSPLNVVQRGFAIVRKPDGTVVQDVSQVKPGDLLEAWLHKGKLRLKVEECLEDWQS
ncbi:MAG TPA: exodeoxyribonuclease VII large subunit [Candidatus Obscuribacterales bacterium]